MSFAAEEELLPMSGQALFVVVFSVVGLVAVLCLKCVEWDTNRERKKV